MPELPEVKTVCNDLCKNFCFKIIKKVELINQKSLFDFDINNLNKISNQKIEKIYQHGKNLIIKTTDYNFLLHLRMEGKFKIIKNITEVNLNHTMMFLYFEDKILAFMDHRKFATIRIYKNSELEKMNQYLSKYGPEPWDLDVEKTYQKIKNKRIAIKSTLLDQKYISGLGNIYVDEVLFASKIHPKTQTNSISKDEFAKIVKNSIKILKHATNLKGTTIKTFHSIGEYGKYQNELKVHMQKDKKCKICGETIIKTVVNGRGTYYCPKEQIQK